MKVFIALLLLGVALGGVAMSSEFSEEDIEAEKPDIVEFKKVPEWVQLYAQERFSNFDDVLEAL